MSDESRTSVLEYEASGVVVAGGEGRLEAHGASLAFDGTQGRVDVLPGPADLLCAALCACMLKSVERFSHMLPFAYERASVRVKAERQDPPPRITRLRYELEVVTDESEHRVELLHKNVRKFGTIRTRSVRRANWMVSLSCGRPVAEWATTPRRQVAITQEKLRPWGANAVSLHEGRKQPGKEERDVQGTRPYQARNHAGG